MYLLAVYVPVNAVESVKDALFKVNVGKYKYYDHCCWQTKGQGQFRPLPGSDPAIGQVGYVEKIEEVKLEFICDEVAITGAIKALRLAHPYEEPAFHVVKLEQSV